MTTRLLIAAALLAVSCSDEEAVDAPVPADSLAAVMADHWERVLSEDPVLAQQLGHEEGFGRLPDPSLAAYWEGVEARRALLARLDALDPGALSAADRLNAALLRHLLADHVEAAAHPGRYLAFTTYASPHSSLVRMAEAATLRTAEDVASYLSRLEAVPSYIEAVIDRLAEAVTEGWTQPCEALDGFERTYRSHIVAASEQSVFFAPVEASPEATAEDRSRAAAAIATRVVPAFAAFGQFYEETYLPNCRQEAGVGGLAGGDAFYAFRTRHFTTTDLTPDEVHAIGLAEVARIREEMAAVARDVGFASFEAYQHHLRTDPSYYPKTPEERIAAASTIAKAMDGQLVKLFAHLPRTPYDIQPIPPDIAEGTTTAYYSPPSADGTRAGTYWLNTTRLESRPLYELESLTFHEAVPGHHLQIALQQEQDLPAFRRFAEFNAFWEGWALYAERLGLEVGFYREPATNFGRLSYEMWRACRLVVDTGIHTKGWSRQQAIDYMLANTGLSAVNITNEVDRYITWPGQALSYKIGELKIRELRSRAEAALGRDFDLRLFHDALLAKGALPLTLLDSEINAWIAGQEGAP